MHSVNPVPQIRIRSANQQPVLKDRDYVLYWMTANRRLGWNFALDRAVSHCRELGRPLVILEALRCDYRWASLRLHRFVAQGMADNAQRILAVGGRLASQKGAASGKLPVLYYPYLEAQVGSGKGLLEALAANACLVVGDEFPCFFLPRMIRTAADRLTCRLEVIDSNGLLPIRASESAFARAHDFRRFLHKTLPSHLDHFPAADALVSLRSAQFPQPVVSAAVIKRWEPAPLEHGFDAVDLKQLPIDHAVGPASMTGGSEAAGVQLRRFLSGGLQRYATGRNHPDEDAASGLSPWLHFGHVGSHQIVSALASQEGWTVDKLAEKPTGKREGWWGMTGPAESFMDELVTWREIGFNMCWHHPEDYDAYSSLPGWAAATIEKHAEDPRPEQYELQTLAMAKTRDPVWNAAQRQLLEEGRMHNYLRMLWGKKIYQWSPDGETALSRLIELNNRYAVDGRNPNSYSGIFWCLGRYDRPWFPERPIFGTLRYMTSDSTQKKLRLKGYLARYSAIRTLW